MGTPFLAEVKIVSFNFPPKGWAMCNGQVMPIAQNQALFSLLGTTYGGNGQTTFALPNLMGRAPVHWGNGSGLPAVRLGEFAGEAAHTLTIAEMASHPHPLSGSSASGGTDPTSAVLGAPGKSAYAQTSPNTAMAAGTVGMSGGGGQPHNNMQPYQVLNFVIALQGMFPSRN